MDSEDEMLCVLAMLVRKRKRKRKQSMGPNHLLRKSQAGCAETGKFDENFQQRNLFQVSQVFI